MPTPTARQRSSEPDRALAPGCSTATGQFASRLDGINGRVREITHMIEDDRYCLDVVTQISAMQAALDEIALGLLDRHAQRCLVGPVKAGKTDELLVAIERFVRPDRSRTRCHQPPSSQR